MDESTEYVSAFVNQDKYPGPALKPRDESPAEPGEGTVILTTQENDAFQRVGGRWHGQPSYYYGYDWPEVMQNHGEDFIVLWVPETGNKSRDVINDLVSAIEAVPGALTVESTSTETVWGRPTEATIRLAGQNHAVQTVVDAFREVARRDFLPSVAPEPRIPPGKMP